MIAPFTHYCCTNINNNRKLDHNPKTPSAEGEGKSEEGLNCQHRIIEVLHFGKENSATSSCSMDCEYKIQYGERLSTTPGYG